MPPGVPPLAPRAGRAKSRDVFSCRFPAATKSYKKSWFGTQYRLATHPPPTLHLFSSREETFSKDLDLAFQPPLLLTLSLNLSYSTRNTMAGGAVVSGGSGGNPLRHGFIRREYRE